MRTATGLPLLLVLLAGCGGDDSAPERVRLLELPLQGSWKGGEREARFADEFSAVDLGEDGWRVVTDQKNPLVVDPSALAVVAGREGATDFVTLTGTGALCRLISVEPGTTYEFVGRLRARDLAPAAEPFHGATFWLGELAGAGSPEELLAAPGKARRRYTAPGALAGPGWQTVRFVFRTTSGTHSLAVAALLALGEELRGGALDLDSAVLTRVEPAVYWDDLAARSARSPDGGPAVPGTRRVLGAMLGAEHRPALLCLPGETVRIDVRVPGGAPVLETGLAPWPADWTAPAPGAKLEFRVAVDGRELLREDVPLPATLGEARWRDVQVDLTPFAGRSVSFAFTVAGPQPGLFSAPVLRDALPPPAVGTPTAKRNLVLISIDTLRADRVGAYGYGQGTTPRIDAFAAGAVLFEQATSQAPYTLPSHATLFSGQYPSVHGVEDAGRVLAPRRSPILAALLAHAGWRTQAFTAGGFLAPDFGFHQGFDGFAIVDPFRHADSSYLKNLPAQLPTQLAPGFAPEPGRAVKDWLTAHADEPFFLFLHTFEVHEYDAPADSTRCAELGCSAPEVDFHKFTLTPKRRDPFPPSPETAHLGHLYDGALRHVDAQVGAVLDELERLHLADRTVVAIVSDHGEELFDRGFLQHGKSVYQELLHVPLIVRIPGQTPRRVREPAALADLAPTLLSALGLPPDPRMQGVDLFGPARARPMWSEVNDHFVHKLALRDEQGWKLIHAPPAEGLVFPAAREWELFDLTDDPGETRDRSTDAPERLSRLQQRHAVFAEELRELSTALGAVESGAELSEETQRLLEQLGYAERVGR